VSSQRFAEVFPEGACNAARTSAYEGTGERSASNRAEGHARSAPMAPPLRACCCRVDIPAHPVTKASTSTATTICLINVFFIGLATFHMG